MSLNLYFDQPAPLSKQKIVCFFYEPDRTTNLPIYGVPIGTTPQIRSINSATWENLIADGLIWDIPFKYLTTYEPFEIKIGANSQVYSLIPRDYGLQSKIQPVPTLPLSLANGGTGTTLSSNPSMLVNLGATTAASVFAAAPRPGVTGTLPVSNGGTGVSSAKGSATQPVYLSDSGLIQCTYQLNKTVPADAVFTDTTDLGSMTGALPVSKLTGTLPIVNGGTGGATQSAAWSNIVAPGGSILGTIGDASRGQILFSTEAQVGYDISSIKVASGSSYISLITASWGQQCIFASGLGVNLLDIQGSSVSVASQLGEAAVKAGLHTQVVTPQVSNADNCDVTCSGIKSGSPVWAIRTDTASNERTAITGATCTQNDTVHLTFSASVSWTTQNVRLFWIDV